VSRSALKLSTEAERRLADEKTALFRGLCRRAGLPEPEREFAFARPDRDWRFDFAWPDRRVALEVEGGVWSAGRHVRPQGFLKDVEKYNAAAGRGWLVFRCTPATLDSLTTVEMIKLAYESTGLRWIA
jgi:hypothetical protein